MFGLGILWRKLDMLHPVYPLVIGFIVVEKLMYVVAHVIAREAFSKYISLNIGMRICLFLYLMLLIDTF
jgi:hypothetical protein